MSNANNTPLSNTPFNTQCEILTDLWLNFRDDEEVQPLIAYYDIGFPLAFCQYEGLVTVNDSGKALISDCWLGVLDAFDVEEDTGFETLTDIVGEE